MIELVCHNTSSRLEAMSEDKALIELTLLPTISTVALLHAGCMDASNWRLDPAPRVEYPLRAAFGKIRPSSSRGIDAAIAPANLESCR